MHTSAWLKTALVCLCARTTAGTVWDLRTDDAFALLHNQAHLASPVNFESDPLIDTTAVYDSTAGLGNGGAVTFDRSKSQFVQGAAHSFLIGSHGFTAVMVVMFTGNAAYYERILDFGNDNLQNIVIGRVLSTGRMMFVIHNRWDTCSVTSPESVIVKDQWLTIIATYEPSDNRLRLRIGNSFFVSDPCVTVRHDRFLQQNYIGKPNTASHEFFQGRIAGLYVVAKTQSHTQVAGLIDKMYTGNDLFCLSCDYICEDASSFDISSMQCKTCGPQVPSDRILTANHICNGCPDRVQNSKYTCECNGMSGEFECCPLNYNAKVLTKMHNTQATQKEYLCIEMIA